MKQKTALTLMAIGVGIKVIDMLRPGTFLNGGVLSGVDNAVPKLNIGGVRTDIAIWLVLIGGVGLALKKL
jgi:hypothetical protein